MFVLLIETTLSVINFHLSNLYFIFLDFRTMLTLSMLQKPLKEVAVALNVNEIYNVEYRPTAGKIFIGVAVYGIINEKFHSILEWYNKAVKHRLRKSAGRSQILIYC